MTGKRSYSDACGIARALDTIGERWALMVARELMLGPKRFTDIRAGLPTVSPDVLAQRLRELEQAGLLRRRTLPPPAASKVYELTPAGLELEPVLVALGRWGGANAPPPTADMGMSFDAHLLSLRTLFVPERADGFDAGIELRLDERPYAAVVADQTFDLQPGELPQPDATVLTSARALIDICHGRRELSAVISADELEIRGDVAAVQRFVTLFPLPIPAATV